MKKTLKELAELFDGNVIGDGNTVIDYVSSIEDGEKGSIAFLANPKYKKYLTDTGCSAVIVKRDIRESSTNLLQVDNPQDVFREIILLFNPPPEITEHSIHKTAVISDNADIGDPVQIKALTFVGDGSVIGKCSFIGEHSYIGKNVRIGENVYMHPRVTILDDCIIGDRVILHSGAVIGSDGFGNLMKNGKYHKIPQTGNVIVGDDVEIGANAAIDRAAMGSTIIGPGCRIDNLVHLAHNVELGENTALAAQTGIAGSTTVGKGVVMGGQVGIIGHLVIGDRVMLGAQAGVVKDIPSGEYYHGTLAKPHMKYKKIEALLNKLPELFQRLKSLEKKI
ncbi:MAG: UDP-3-O-(3-hydroxymyristoyl)glucosamine N-acyltransferase [bacterium]|nr:UDP-3-O-(3-hydroxymyristoyl)glucosamine N-acyltransferase [bacterium]